MLKANQKVALAILLFFMTTTCVLQAAPYTNSNPLLIGVQTAPQLCATNHSCTYTSMIVKLSGNFDLIPTINSTGAWQAGFTPNEDGLHYLDGNSSSSSQIMNLPSYAYGTGGFTGNLTSPNWTPANSQYFGTLAGAATPFRFQQNSGSNLADLTVVISLLAGVQNLYWRDPSVPNVLYSILDPTNSIGDNVPFTPSNVWEFVFYDGTSNMASGNNGTNKAFAVMQGQPDPSTETPEPASSALVGICLVVFAAYRHRKLQQQS